MPEICFRVRFLKYILVLVFAVAFMGVSAQSGGKKTSMRDSLDRLLLSAKTDSARISQYLTILNNLGDRDLSLHYADELMAIATSRNDTNLMIKCEQSYSYAYLNDGDSKGAEKHISNVVKLALPTNNLKVLAKSYYLYAVCCEDGDNIAGMLDYGNKSLDIYRQLNDTAHILDIYLMYAQSCGTMNMYKTAYEYLVRAILLSHNSSFDMYTVDATVFYASTMLMQFDNEYYPSDVRLCKFSKIISYCTAVSQAYQRSELNSYYYRQLMHLCHITKAHAYLRSAEIVGSKALADSCALYLQKSKDAVTDNKGLLFEASLVEAGLLYFQGHYTQAEKMLSELEIMDFPHIVTMIKQVYSLQTKCYQKLGNQTKMLECIEKADLYDKISTREITSKQYADFKTKLISQKQVELIEAGKQKDSIKKNGEIKRQNYITSFLILLTILILVLTAVIVNSLNGRRRINNQVREKNDEITKVNGNIISQKKEIAQRRDIITMQYDMVENFNESIMSNIKYAGKIQRAAIPSEREVKKYFRDCFVLFRPRDIVSGDFYLVKSKGDFYIFIVADCTGHGVPGALLSMLGISALNDILQNAPDNDLFSVSEVLEKMRQFILSAFEGRKGLDIYDGMDMTICALDTRNNDLHFAAGNQSAIVWRKDSLIRLKGDKMPIGRYIREAVHFSEQTISLHTGDMVYMFTDGIIDQLGGSESKKFLMRNLSLTLESIGAMPSFRQKLEIEATLDIWRGTIPQIDDVTVAGFRV